ncbi:MAG: hypothetical protein ACOYKN_00585 [Pirellula sp.]
MLDRPLDHWDFLSFSGVFCAGNPTPPGGVAMREPPGMCVSRMAQAAGDGLYTATAPYRSSIGTKPPFG